MEPTSTDAELITQYVSTHDPKLREELILRYVPLVHFVLGRLGLSQSMGADYEDAASQGLLGLIEAVDRYDPDHGAQLSTYATLRIRGNVLDHLRSLDWLSRGARRRARLVQDAITTLWQELLRSPTNEELAAYLDIDLPKVGQALIDSSRMIVSLDAVVDNNVRKNASLHEILPDESQADLSKRIEEDEMKSTLVETLLSLPERERLIMSLYYYDELTFKEIGAVLDVSESRICQLHGRAVMSLRAMLSHDTSRTQQGDPKILRRGKDLSQETRVKTTDPTGRR